MDQLLSYLNAMSVTDRDAFATRCGTTVNYLRKAISVGQDLRESLCIAIERESKGAIRCEMLRPEGVDWAYLRGTKRRAAA